MNLKLGAVRSVLARAASRNVTPFDCKFACRRGEKQGSGASIASPGRVDR